MKLLLLPLLFCCLCIEHTYGQVSHTYNLSVTSPCISNGINEKSMDFKVYPNPAVFDLTIDLSENEGTFQLIDMQGKEVVQEPFTTHHFKIDIHELGSGIYTGIIRTESHIYRTKISIQ